MKVRHRHRFPPVHAEPGDSLLCQVNDYKGGKFYQHQENLGRKMVIDTIVTFDVDAPTLGLVDGIGAIFGESQ